MPMSDDTARTMRQVRSRSTNFNARAEEDGPVIDGYFAVFNSDYEIWPGAREQVAPTAFTSSLGGDVRALCDHLTHLVLGRTAAGTLSLEVDDRGLWGSIKINEHDGDAMNLYARVQRGDVSQCSFGFDIVDEEYTEFPDGTCLWVIRDVILYEVSVCTFPAYAETSVEARRRDQSEMRCRMLRQRKTNLKERMQKWH